MVTAPSNEILIRCEAGRRHGLGHLMRCLTLADGFRSHGYEATLVAHDPDGVGRQIAGRHKIGFLQSPGDSGSPADNAFLAEVARSRNATVVLDSKDIDVAACDAVFGMLAGNVLVCLDDEQYRDLPCDVLVNPNVWVQPRSYPSRTGRTVLAGAGANLIRREFFERSEQLARADPVLLLTLGGEDPGNDTLWLLQTLADVLDDSALDIVVGPAHPAPDSVIAIARERFANAECVIDPPDMHRYIGRADIAITACGTTCYELAAAGVPQLGVIVEPHQERLAMAMQDSGCMTILGDHGSMLSDAVRDSVRRLLDDSATHATMSAAGRHLFPRSGVDLIVQTVESKITRSQELKHAN